MAKSLVLQGGLRVLDTATTALAARLIRLSSVVLAICVSLALGFFIWEGIRSDAFDAALTSTVSLITGLSTPAADLPVGQRILAWAVILAGWLILPTTVALLLGAAERKLETDAEWEYELTKLGHEHGLDPETAREFAQRAKEIAKELTNAER